MAVFDPWECEAARMCLQAGNPQAAARLLLATKHRDNRTVRQLLLECNAQLAQQARAAYLQGERDVAARVLSLAAGCADLTGDAVVLQNQLMRVPEETIAMPATTIPLGDRNKCFALRGRAVVVAAPVAVLGSVRNKDAHGPLLGRLHREHALVSRHEGQHWLSRAPHHDDLVTVNGVELAAPVALEDGDEIILGARTGRGQCELTFHRPDPASATAVLRQKRRKIVTPSGDAFSELVLLGDYLTLGRSETAHLPAPQLACLEARLTWSDLGLAASAAGGVVYEESPDGDWNDPPTPLRLPCRLAIHGDGELADQILQDYQHGERLDEHLELFDPCRRN